MLQPKALEGAAPLQVPPQLPDGWEDAAGATLISPQGQGCARAWGQCFHGLTELGPGTMCGGCEGDPGLVRAAAGWRELQSLEK